jgi:TPR repeat protein
MSPSAQELASIKAAAMCRHRRVWAVALRKLRWLWPGWHPSMPCEYTGDPDRSKVVTGYGNALFNLGWRYERGWGVRRNLPEAVRCYFKSSKLGNLDATVRLSPAQSELEQSTEVPDPPVPVMPIWREWKAAEDERRNEKREHDAVLDRQAYEWLVTRGVSKAAADPNPNPDPDITA